jgi:hypothetical protein
MKTLRSLMLSILLLLTLLMPVASFAFVSGSTGALGDLTPTANTVLPMPENGVFNYGVVNIPTGVTVTFTKNTANTPVTILATGDVTINGTISVNGANGTYVVPGAGGPGGFEGGQGGTQNQAGRRGAGPGGGAGGAVPATYPGNAGGGGFGVTGVVGGAVGWGGYPAGAAGGPTYGNIQIAPLIGGSGGGGGGSISYFNSSTGTYSYFNGGGGGGGGGAIVIASSGTITVSGTVTITANGGNAASGEGTNCTGSGSNCGGGGGGGSGGAIRLVATNIALNSTISASGGNGGYGLGISAGNGGLGRIRLEAENFRNTVATSPPFTMGNAYSVVPLNLPVLSIVSVGGTSVSAGPKGSYISPDLILPSNITNPVTVVVAGTNIPVGTMVTLKSTPSIGTAVSSTPVPLVLGNDASSTTASVALSISSAYPSIITASVTYQLSASSGGPFFAEGERIDKVRVATNLAGGSTVTYITESGREIPAVL